ncbi:MAG: hypothetical protein K0S76_2978 [Herbinix sp.]|jgi:NOL1/NOP2/sun family putative RNA methylase|nr:hypothetical protein [Herbinix sp.]
MNLPKLFEDRMRTLLGEEYEEYLQCYSQPHFGGLRVNTLKITPEEFERICPFSIKRIPWITNGYYYDTKEQPARHPYYYAGLYYIQEPSAMTPASLLPIEKGDKVLDICAAPGGKSTELGAKLGGEGILVSNDISNSRAKALLKNIELFGIRNSLVLSEAPNKLADYFPEYFDKILIDAPCSGEGMFRKSPAIMKNWEQYGVDYYNKLQKEIILFAAKMLKPGGMMLYSTCTFSPEEDEGTVSFLLEQCPEFQVVNAIPDEETCKKLGLSYEGFDYGKPEWVENGKEELKYGIRLWPHKINGEGHFMALLRKNGVTEDKSEDNYSDINLSAKNKTLISEETREFLHHLGQINNNQSNESSNPVANTSFPEEQFVIREDRVYLLPKGLPDLKGLRILRQGLLLGEMKKQRFEPSQALANALYKHEYDKIIDFDNSNPKVIRYLKCEAIEPTGSFEDGWYLICVDGFPLGWSKTAKDNFKNKYLPGWRWM